METLGALVVILLVATLVVWLLVRRPRCDQTPAPSKSHVPGAATPDHVREIVRPTVRIEVTAASPAGPRYDETAYPTQAVGESYNQAPLRSIAEAHPGRGRLEDSAACEVQAMLIPELENQHDANAVRVEIEGKKVGYLSRPDAVRYRSVPGRRSPGPIAALIVGGWNRGADDRGDYGVRLALPLAEPSTVAPGLTLTPGSYGYDIVNEDLEACATLTTVGDSALVEVNLVPIVEEQCVAVVSGDAGLGSIHGAEAQVIIRAGGLTAVPARVSIRRRRAEDARGGTYATVKLALRVDTAALPRERVSDGCARTPGSYGQHVQGVHRYTAILKRLCPDGITGRARAALRATEGGFLVTIDDADIGTVLTADAAYAASQATGEIEVDALIAKRTGGVRGYRVHLAVHLARPAPE
jgi:hypothetical protein